MIPSRPLGSRLVAVGMVTLAIAACSRPVEPTAGTKPIPDLLKDLTSATEAVRNNASDALRASAAMVVPVLVEMARSDDTEFNKQLKAVVGTDKLDELKLAPPVVRRAQALNGFRALGAAGAPAVPALLGMARDTKTSVTATLAMACIGGDTLNPLVDMLSDPNPRLVGNALTALDSVNPSTPDAARVLLARLRDTNAVARAAVARALGRSRQEPETSVVEISRLLHDREEAVQVAACVGLGALESRAVSAVPFLLPLAKKAAEKSLRDSAGIAVWRISPDEARKAGIDESLIKPVTYTGPSER